MSPSELPPDPYPGTPGASAGGFEPASLDPYRLWDAAYVLGSLSPAERWEFEEHLADCDHCRDAVSELAGVPGLLAQISPDEVTTLLPPEPLTEVAEARPGVLAELKPRRRWLGALVGLAAALALLAGVLGVVALRGALPGQSAPSGAPIRLAFTPVAPTDILAVVDVVSMAEGTEFDVACIYTDEGGKQTETRQEYDIVVLDRRGRATTVKTWTARPDHMMTPSGVASLPLSKIDSVEIRPARSAQAVLRAELR